MSTEGVQSSEAPPTYGVARIIVRYGKLAEFAAAMEQVVLIMEELGWRLNASYQTIIGNFHEVYDIWELPDANAVATGLAGAAADPRFAEVGPVLASSIESETFTIVAKTPFSP